jgi:hypothetical protein
MSESFTPEAIEKIRGRIDGLKLVTRLQGHALGGGTGTELAMSDTQIKAAGILLRKVLPDLTHVDHAGATGPLQVEIVQFGGDASGKGFGQR